MYFECKKSEIQITSEGIADEGLGVTENGVILSTPWPGMRQSGLLTELF